MLLTIITITRDDPDGLARTLASCSALRLYPCVEHITINGGNTGVDSFGSVRVVTRKARGIADAFNAGLAEARGDWIWFLNGGDRIEPNLEPEFLLTILRNSKADVIVGGTVYAETGALMRHALPSLRWPPVRAWIQHPSTLIRRNMFERFGLFDEDYTIAMDYEWWLRALSANAPVDVLSIAFTIFAPGGISQLRGSHTVILKEMARAVRTHKAILLKTFFKQTGVLLRELARSYKHL